MTENDIEPGLYDMPEAQYFAHPAISNSGLKAFARSPAHYLAERETPRKPTPSMLAGTAIHSALLEPEAFAAKYIHTPAGAPRRPTEAQLNAKNPSESSIKSIEFWTAFEAKARGRIVLDKETYDEYQHIGNQARQHPELATLLTGGYAEKTVFGRDPETGVMCRIRVDYYTTVGDRRVMIDVKSTEDARPHRFQKTAYDYGYFHGAAFYSDVWAWAGMAGEIDTYIILALERDAPYGIYLYEVGGQALERGRAAYRTHLNHYAECLAADNWPGYSTDIVPLLYPSWAQE